MRITKVAPVIATPKTKRKRREEPKYQYLGETDPAVYIHSNRTHRTASEAFKDADYATPIWRCENDWDRTKEYLGWGAMWAILLVAMYLLASAFY
jgi:hypothetical protein